MGVSNLCERPSLWTSWCWIHQMTHLRSWPLQLWSILLAMHLKFWHWVCCELLSRPIDKINMTQGRGRWPRDLRKLGWFSCALLLEKSVLWWVNSKNPYCSDNSMCVYIVNAGRGNLKESAFKFSVNFQWKFMPCLFNLLLGITIRDGLSC